MIAATGRMLYARFIPTLTKECDTEDKCPFPLWKLAPRTRDWGHGPDDVVGFSEGKLPFPYCIRARAAYC